MGGSQSKTTISSLTEAISDIAMQTVQSCEVVVQQEQDVTIINQGFSWGNDRSIAQTTAIKQDCFADINRQSMLQNKIIDAISQATTSSSIAVLGAFGSSQADAAANLTNIVRNNVTFSNIQKTYSEIKQSQKVTYVNEFISIGDKLDISQGAQAFAAATIKEVEKAGIFNIIEEHIDQTADAKQDNPLDFIAKAIGAVGEVVSSALFFYIFIIAAAALGLVLILRAMGSADSGSPQEPMSESPQESMSAPPGQESAATNAGMAALPAPQSMPQPVYRPQYAPPQYVPRSGTPVMTKLSSVASGAAMGAKVPGPPQLKAAAAVTGAVAGLRA